MEEIMKAAKILLISLCLFQFLFFRAATSEGGITQLVIDEYRQVKERVEKLPQTKAGKYAKEVVENVSRSILMAREGLEAGDEKRMKEAVDMAKIQITFAEAVAEERETAEKIEVLKAELKLLEQRLNDYLSAKGAGR
jgi:polyhydroxyalkanoate synthesis regulator phasin